MLPLTRKMAHELASSGFRDHFTSHRKNMSTKLDASLENHTLGQKINEHKVMKISFFFFFDYKIMFKIMFKIWSLLFKSS